MGETFSVAGFGGWGTTGGGCSPQELRASKGGSTTMSWEADSPKASTPWHPEQGSQPCCTWSSDLQSCELINRSCFKPLNLYYFNVAVENEYILLTLIRGWLQGKHMSCLSYIFQERPDLWNFLFEKPHLPRTAPVDQPFLDSPTI